MREVCQHSGSTVLRRHDTTGVVKETWNRFPPLEQPPRRRLGNPPRSSVVGKLPLRLRSELVGEKVKPLGDSRGVRLVSVEFIDNRLQARNDVSVRRGRIDR